ncbi:uncharacterized protein LOC131614509 [Vicia villosa]|uniref:uncharacterized protein LOC131614509 n=1 Tax=Vicia villosa TaxID=3911 RepID=UPI00273B4A7F|nr:uncharacterized protein LOC131614509 [Vicia villosa]
MEHFLADISAFEKLSNLHLTYFVTIESLLHLLLKSPCLETLVLEGPIYSDNKPPNFASVPECFLSTLKVVRFEKFAGGEPEFNFAKFVMEKSQILESISFSCYKLRGAKLKKVKKKIFLVKRSLNKKIFLVKRSFNVVVGLLVVVGNLVVVVGNIVFGDFVGNSVVVVVGNSVVVVFVGNFVVVVVVGKFMVVVVGNTVVVLAGLPNRKGQTQTFQDL